MAGEGVVGRQLSRGRGKKLLKYLSKKERLSLRVSEHRVSGET